MLQISDPTPRLSEPLLTKGGKKRLVQSKAWTAGLAWRGCEPLPLTGSPLPACALELFVCLVGDRDTFGRPATLPPILVDALAGVKRAWAGSCRKARGVLRLSPSLGRTLLGEGGSQSPLLVHLQAAARH